MEVDARCEASIWPWHGAWVTFSFSLLRHQDSTMQKRFGFLIEWERSTYTIDDIHRIKGTSAKNTKNMANYFISSRTQQIVINSFSIQLAPKCLINHKWFKKYLKCCGQEKFQNISFLFFFGLSGVFWKLSDGMPTKMSTWIWVRFWSKSCMCQAYN